MHEVIISDTSCLILLDKIGQLDLLNKVYGKLVITHEILKEFGLRLPNWVEVRRLTNKSVQTALEQTLDLGEASAIALAIENPSSLLIIDDLKARKMAKALNLRLTGTLGVIFKAKEIGVINKIGPVINQLIQEDFRISDNVVSEILRKSGES
ncbi:MAG: DUF3368 domain-containing protein [Cyclobacteriaceae bacterium]